MDRKGVNKMNKTILDTFSDRLGYVIDDDETLRSFMIEEATEVLDSYDHDDTDYLEELAFQYFYECIFKEIKLEGLEEFLSLNEIKLKARIYQIIQSIK